MRTTATRGGWGPRIRTPDGVATDWSPSRPPLPGSSYIPAVPARLTQVGLNSPPLRAPPFPPLPREWGTGHGSVSPSLRRKQKERSLSHATSAAALLAGDGQRRGSPPEHVSLPPTKRPRKRRASIRPPRRRRRKLCAAGRGGSRRPLARRLRDTSTLRTASIAPYNGR